MNNQDGKFGLYKSLCLARLTFLLSIWTICSYSNITLAQDFDASSTTQNDPVGQLSTCSTELLEIQEQVFIDYDPFLAGAKIEPIKFTLSNVSSSDCVLNIATSLQDVLPSFEYQFGDTGVKAELRAADNQVGLSRSKKRGVFTAFLAGGQSAEFSIDAVIIEDAVAAAADHRLTLDFKVISVNNAATPELFWQTDLVLRSIPRAQVNLSGVRGAYGDVGTMSSVDFGIAKKGASRLIYVQLRANTSANLTITSENEGVLRHKEKPKTAPPIPYFVKLDDEPLDLTETHVQTFDLPKTYAGKSFPMTLTLGDPREGMAGRYTDTIVFEFSPL